MSFSEDDFELLEAFLALEANFVVLKADFVLQKLDLVV